MKNHTEFKGLSVEFTIIAIEGNMDDLPFKMGGESWSGATSKPVHRIQLSDFGLCTYPVTQAVWAYVMRNTDMETPSYFNGLYRPVEQVSWNDIKNEFLPRLNKMTEGLRPHSTEYRLPTEAEWEYSARGGKYWKAFPFDFSGSNKLDEVGWYRDNSHSETKPVGLKAPNFLGLYDMSGNVWEWCEDAYDGDFYKKCKQQKIVTNPCNYEGTYHVYRGGSWDNYDENCRSMRRYFNSSSNRDNSLGFRLVLSYP